MDWFRRHYLSIDPRTLGLTRILLGALLLFDLAKRLPGAEHWYTMRGLLPNSTTLQHPLREWQFSLFFGLVSDAEVTLGLFACAVCYLALLVGYRTRLAHLLSLVALYSLQVRVDFVSNGGDFVLCGLLLWTLWLPMGRRFSLDASLATLRRFREASAAHLALAAARPELRDRTPVVSLAVFAVTLQLAAIYFFNAVHKHGETWVEGSAIYWVLHQERVVTWLGHWLREAFSLQALRPLSYATLLIEGAAPLLILSPWGRPWTRRVALVSLWALHAGIASTINVGLFSPTMMVFVTLLLERRDWDALERWARGRERRRRVAYFDAGCGMCFQIARVLMRADLFGRIRFVASDSAASEQLPERIAAADLDRTIVVTDPGGGRVWTRAAAVAQLLACLPLGALLALPVWLTLPLANVCYDWVARTRTRISLFFGLAACSLPAMPAPMTTDLESSTQAKEVWQRVRAALREALVAVLMLVAGMQLLIENPAVPRALRPHSPRWHRAAVSYTRLQQGWRMFAPEAPRRDMTVIVDARTVDGRRVDPYNEVASRLADPTLRHVPERLAHNVYWCDYTVRIPNARHLHGALESWIFAHAERTGRARDRIVSFEAYAVERVGIGPDSETHVRRFLAGRR